jgi:hypothetical protein
MQSLIRLSMEKQSHMANSVNRRRGGRLQSSWKSVFRFYMSICFVEDETSSRPVPSQTNRTSMFGFRFQSLTPVNEVSRASQLLCSSEFVYPITFHWWASIGLFKSNSVYLLYFKPGFLIYMNYTRSCLYWRRNRFCNISAVFDVLLALYAYTCNSTLSSDTCLQRFYVHDLTLFCTKLL